jgi:hypothetical protein
MAPDAALGKPSPLPILHLLCERSSIRAVTRLTGASKKAVGKRIQVNEIWAFVYAKQKNVATAKAAPDGAGDVWTWTAINADTKLIPSWFIGGRDSECATWFMNDLAARLANRVQLTSDGHKAYLDAVEGAFGADIDYAMLVKLYGASPDSAKGGYSPADCTGAVKRQSRASWTRRAFQPAIQNARTSQCE